MSTNNFSTNPEGTNKEVERKLIELEHDIDKESHSAPVLVSSDELVKIPESVPVKDDLYYFAGLAMIGFSVLVFFQHIHLGTGWLQAFGMGGGGFGLLLIPLLIGIGLVVYNKKNKIGYGILAVTCALIFYTVLSSLIMTFTPISLLGLIIMLAPLAVGISFVVKGMGGPKGIEHKVRQTELFKTYIDSGPKS